MVAQGYAGGVPMGADLPARPSGAAAPAILASAMRDPGTPESPGAPLQRVQIVKVWVTPDGEAHEKVFDVAGDPHSPAGVDPLTCTPVGAGADTLCTVWIDPEFDPTARAAYYARALENPTCRWSAWVCSTLSPAEQAALHCDDLGAARTIQERAWSSPVWYTPGG
jgi:hypothetical protein